MDAQTILADIQQHNASHSHWATVYALRALSPDQFDLQPGDEIPNSYDGFGRDIDDPDLPELEGCSCIGIAHGVFPRSSSFEEAMPDDIAKALDLINRYNCGVIALVAGLGYEDGTDEKEWVVRGAEIAARYEIA